jgi:site-specific DNA-adenine methylase
MIKPLFPYYGSKWRDSKRYPAPRGHVIEPFAGSAGYSLWWEPEHVTLVDLDPIIVGVWTYLRDASTADILGLPDLEVGQSTDDLNVPQEAKWLIGFWLNRGSAQPKKTQTAFSRRTDRAQLVWSERARVRIAAEHHKIAHWKITEGSYADIAPLEAMWFIDPPYVDKGRYYRYSAVDYAHLADWCHTLDGDVIVCEQAGAAWLPFKPLATIKSTKGTSAEVIWTPGEIAVSQLALLKPRDTSEGDT